MAITLDKLTYQEHSEKELREALGALLLPWSLDDYPDEADVVQDAIVEALCRRRDAGRCSCGRQGKGKVNG